jgi:hypothetical protein
MRKPLQGDPIAPTLFIAPAIFVIGLFLLFFLWLCLEASRAEAHEAPTGWNCRQVPDTAIEETPQGYVIRATGELIPYTDPRVRDSKDEFYHWCSVGGTETGRTICLYRAPRGF